MSKMSELKKILPRPSGYHILVAIPPAKATVGPKNLIIAPDDLAARENTASIAVNVIAVGPDAYADKTKFPTGPWCKEGDWVIVRSYSGTRLVVKEQEFRIINDDTVQAVVDDPRLVERAV